MAAVVIGYASTAISVTEGDTATFSAEVMSGNLGDLAVRVVQSTMDGTATGISHRKKFNSLYCVLIAIFPVLSLFCSCQLILAVVCLLFVALVGFIKCFLFLAVVLNITVYAMWSCSSHSCRRGGCRLRRRDTGSELQQPECGLASQHRDIYGRAHGRN